ncbi:MAG: GNAT family N-acetyltransferase, partial [Candidatus Limnocylindrales bacterium]
MAPAGLRLRAERPADGPSIRALNLAAFPTSAEADLVERIRASGTFRPELSLVAQIGTRTVGHLLLSPVTLQTANGPVPVLALAPMAVLPDHQRQGI